MKPENKILLNHGSGGKLMSALINDLFFRYFSNPLLLARTDSAILDFPAENLAFTTDSFVVDPLFFPGGNIGKLAVCGTVNDLAVSGACPLYLSCGFIIEEGFTFESLEIIVKSMAGEAENAGVQIVTGDTKVVEKGKCDKIFINTSGVGLLEPRFRDISFGTKIKPGDRIILNGYAGDHGVAILTARKGIETINEIRSDCGSLNHLVSEILSVHDGVRFMRDPTRGGVATVLCELAEDHHLGIEVYERQIPVRNEVRGICEAFGFDPLYLANEGKVVIVAGEKECGQVLDILKKNPLGTESTVIGEITGEHPGKVVLNTAIGGRRIMDRLAGDQLPRIC